MRVILEKEVVPHDPQLYHSDRIAPKLAGFSAIDDAAARTFRDTGFLVIAGGLDVDEVRSAKSTLEAMTLAADPRCGTITYESTIRGHLNMERLIHQNIDGDVKVAALPRGEITEMIPDMDPRLRSGFVRRFSDFTRTHPELAGVADKPAMIEAITCLIGEPVRQFQDMAMIKPPNGREKPWHQDHAYFNLPIDTPIMGVWIALDKATPEDGCMYMLAGAHKDGPRIHFMRRDWQICDTEMAGCQSVCVPMEAGDVLLFDGKLPHGTPTNRTNDYRWALQLHYIPDSAIEVDERIRLDAFGNEGKGAIC